MSTRPRASLSRRVMSSSAWLGSSTPEGWLCAKMTPRQLHRRLEDRVARRPDARLCEAALRFRVQELAQRAKICDQAARQLDRAAPRGSGAKQQRDELGIRERVRAALEQLLPRPLPAGPVPDAHYLQF